MIKKELIQEIYNAASIQRWNDHVRPVNFTELDKQSHKMVLAFVIAKFEKQDKGIELDWNALIQGALFEFLHRVVLTDIKPPVFHKMMKEKGEQLNAWTFERLDPSLSMLGQTLNEKFQRYFKEENYSKIEKRILKAAHYLATNWEFKIIYHACPFIYGIEKTKENIENEIEDHYDLIGVQKISLQKKSYGFIDLCGQLRFQKRWAHSPRIPQTSVLGHMLVVAFLTYFCCLEINATPIRCYNNFFSALFHDLPEILTRDIINPIKGAIEGLEDIITEYEEMQLEEIILPLLPYSWHDEIKFFVSDVFKNRIRCEGKVSTEVIYDEYAKKSKSEEIDFIDGELIQACDHLAAYIEASLSIKHGITSKQLLEGIDFLYEKYKGKKILGINFGELFDDFIPEKTVHPW